MKQKRIDSFSRKYALYVESKKCMVCGFSVIDVLNTHHIKPLAEGGELSFTNIIVLCPNCHALSHLIRKKGYGIESLMKRTQLTKEQCEKLIEIAKVDSE